MNQSIPNSLKDNTELDIYFSKYDIQQNKILTTRKTSINLMSFVKDIVENPDLLLDEDRKSSEVYKNLKNYAAYFDKLLC